MKDEARSHHRQGDLTPVEDRGSDLHLPAELAWIGSSDKGNEPGCAGREEYGDGHQKRESEADRKASPGWNGKQFDEANEDGPSAGRKGDWLIERSGLIENPEHDQREGNQRYARLKQVGVNLALARGGIHPPHHAGATMRGKVALSPESLVPLQ